MHHQRLQQLRHVLEQQGLDGYIIPSVDPYQSEYPPACYRRLEWLTGFTGSMGLAIVLKDSAAFFTDGRYTLQAQQQVNTTDYEHMLITTHSPWEWMREKKLVLGYDPMLHSQEYINRYPHTKPVHENLLDTLWEGRPSSPASRIQSHAITYAGQASEEKITQITQHIIKAGADACLLTDPASICWLLNVRGADTPNTPLILGYAIVYVDGNVEWFVENKRPGDALPKSVVVYGMELLEKRIEQLAQVRVLIDTHNTPIGFSSRLKHHIQGENPCALPKACKNPIEVNGARQAHIRDGVAVTKLLCWLDHNHAKQPMTEISVAEKLLQFRSKNDWFVMPSFDTIAGHGPHGAIVHYHATEQSNRPITEGHLLLLDSGGQYSDGTTDVTRTLPIGAPTTEYKHHFTHVLKGHIALAQAVFPKGTTGSALDVLARQYLWQIFLDYEHGTGHGVGSFLGVHEGPQRISKSASTVALQPGMILSNEPGYYKEGSHGIRIENLVLVVDKGHGFYGFETLTLVPMDTRLVDYTLLTQSEQDWLVHYHERVTEALNPHLSPEERSWLEGIVKVRGI